MTGPRRRREWGSAAPRPMAIAAQAGTLIYSNFCLDGPRRQRLPAGSGLVTVELNPLSGRGPASLVDDFYHGPARVPCKWHNGEGRFPSHPRISLKIGGEPAFPVIAKNARVTGSI